MDNSSGDFIGLICSTFSIGVIRGESISDGAGAITAGFSCVTIDGKELGTTLEDDRTRFAGCDITKSRAGVSRTRVFGCSTFSVVIPPNGEGVCGS